MVQVSTFAAEPPSDASLEAELGRWRPHPGTILVVEDCDDVRRGLAQLLELNGFRVQDVRDAEHALDHLKSHPEGFALVLMDLLLPCLSGADLRAMQLADPQLAAIPSVVMSACEREVPVYTLLQPAEWIEKPFHWEQLLGIVQRYVTPEKDSSHLIDWTATP